MPVATPVMVRHASIGVAGGLVRIAFAMDLARTFERCGGRKLARVHRRRRNKRRHQEAQKKQASMQHAKYPNDESPNCHVSSPVAAANLEVSASTRRR